jgi:hypothetical protein
MLCRRRLAFVIAAPGVAPFTTHVALSAPFSQSSFPTRCPPKRRVGLVRRRCFGLAVITNESRTCR